MIPRDLVSKLLAAGLTAGLFLVWWPSHHATTGIEPLVVRGALWTLAYEVLVLAFMPLERAARRALQPTLVAAERVRRRVWRLDVPAPARLGGACVLACAGALLPMTLLAGAHPLPTASAHPVKKVIVVKRPVVRERVVVREIVRVPADTSRPGDTPQPTTSYVAPTNDTTTTTRRSTSSASKTSAKPRATQRQAKVTHAPIATIPEATPPVASTTPAAPSTATASTPEAASPAATDVHTAS